MRSLSNKFFLLFVGLRIKISLSETAEKKDKGNVTHHSGW